MNRVLFVFFLVGIVAANGFAQRKLPLVYGTAKIDNETFMAVTEVTLKDWMGFVANSNFDESLFPDSKCISHTTELLFNDLRKQHDFEYLKMSDNPRHRGDFGLKDIAEGKDFKKLADADPFYFSLKLPVTGITFEQAQRFCKWKEACINSNRGTDIMVSLPSADLYKKLITDRDSLNKNCDCALFNYSTAKNVHLEKDKNSVSQGRALVLAASYMPTDLGLYGLQGNAAEMTDVYGIAMGGSFKQTARESYSDRVQKYSKAEDWLGFRYVVTGK